jgi:hypothetical protein
MIRATSRLLLILLVLSGLGGCGKDAEPPAVLNANPRDITGELGSTMWPPRIAGFSRGQALLYGSGDMSVAYGLLAPDPRAVATVYLVWRDEGSAEAAALPSLQDYYEAGKRMIEQFHAGAQLVEEAPVSVWQTNGRVSGQKAVYALATMFGDRQQYVYTELYVFRIPGRLIKFRYTYPVAEQKPAQAAFLQLMETLDWSNPNPL